MARLRDATRLAAASHRVAFAWVFPMSITEVQPIMSRPVQGSWGATTHFLHFAGSAILRRLIDYDALIVNLSVQCNHATGRRAWCADPALALTIERTTVELWRKNYDILLFRDVASRNIINGAAEASGSYTLMTLPAKPMHTGCLWAMNRDNEATR